MADSRSNNVYTISTTTHEMSIKINKCRFALLQEYTVICYPKDIVRY